ncbi:MAG: class IV adenylate cyclase [Acidilobaceae archaeon]|nr:class IV adenylate cyclase [Acidilobaceae archaeon]MCX8165510.1 class IV adenylate cyclase [Acidilobaceae archaeon]MDW7973937.1 class IV adenylate cyclase [Sulfolobales archaeon]
MIEVEGKFRVECSRLEGLRAQLTGMGLNYLGRREEVDSYFSHPCRDFLKTDEALRVRRGGGELTLTYKGPRERGEMKRRLELTLNVSGDAESLLERLGFKLALEIRKRRDYFESKDLVVSLDEVEGLGCFVEIESKGGRAEDVMGLAESLGLGKESYVEKTYVEMVLEKKSNPS